MILLDNLKQKSGDNELLYQDGHDATKVMSEDTVNNALLVMEYDSKIEVCGHGLRSMARWVLSESGLWSDDAIDLQLIHSELNNVHAVHIDTS